jgi:hypothetical protein
LTLNAEKTGLVWADVTGASGYEVKVNDGEYAAAASYDFSAAVGKYAVSVKSVGDGTNYSDSEAATWDYETKEISLSAISVSGMTATWTAVGNVTSAFSATGDLDSETWSAAVGGAYAAASSGKLGVSVNPGYDSDDNLNYVGTAATEYRWIVEAATENRVVLSNKTEVDDGLISYFYSPSTNAWEDAGAHAALSVNPADVEEADPVIDFKIQQSFPYKFASSVSTLDSYAGLSLKVKGDDKTAMLIQLTGSEGYVSLNLGVISSNWNLIYVPFSDAGWIVGGTSYTLAQFATAKGFGSASDALYAFNEIDLVYKTVGDSSYQYTHDYLSDMTLVAKGDGSFSQSDDWTVAGSYTGVNATSGIDFKLESDGTAITLSSLNLESNLNATLAETDEGDAVTFKTADGGASLTYVGTVTEKGRAIAFKSASGTYAPYLTNVSFNYVYTIDDFEDYAETGVGYDKNNKNPGNRTGLRAAYYSEYYSGDASDSDELSGSKWSLMGSDNYLNLATDASEVHSGKQAADFKTGNSMRYSTYGVSDGTATALPRGDTFSFFAKNASASDVTCYVRLFQYASVNIGNIGDALATITIPASSDYAQYTVALSASKHYYGYSLNFGYVKSGSRMYVDDVQLYTGVNPYSHFVDGSPIKSGTVYGGSNAYMSSVVGTLGNHSSISVVATPKGASAINLAGTYTVDAETKEIVIDCGADLVYTGLLSVDRTCISYVSATGNYGAYCANLFLQARLPNKTRLISYDNMTASSLQDLVYVDRDLNNSGTFTTYAPGGNSDFVGLETTGQDAGFASAAFAVDTTAAKIGKYRYRWSQEASLGSFSNFSFRVKNTSSLKITAQLYVCTVSGSSATRLSTSAGSAVAAGSDWMTVSGSLSSVKDVYGFSIFVYTDYAPSSDVVTGTMLIDNVLAW